MITLANVYSETLHLKQKLGLVTQPNGRESAINRALDGSNNPD